MDDAKKVILEMVLLGANQLKDTVLMDKDVIEMLNVKIMDMVNILVNVLQDGQEMVFCVVLTLIWTNGLMFNYPVTTYVARR